MAERIRALGAVGIGILIVLVLGISACSGQSQGPGSKEIVLATWGGEFGESLYENSVRHFEEETGYQVTMSYGLSFENIAKLESQQDNPQVDVVMLGASLAPQAWDEGLLDPLQEEELPNLAELYPWAVFERDGQIIMAGMYAYTTGICYRTDMIDRPVTSWMDFWRMTDEDQSVRVVLPTLPWENSRFVAMIARLEGGGETNINPGFEKIKELAPRAVTVFQDDTQLDSLLRTGEAWMAPCISFTASTLMEDGVEVEYVLPEEGGWAGIDVVMLVKGSPNPEGARELANWLFSPEGSKAHALNFGMLPTNQNAELTADEAADLPTKEQLDQLEVFDDYFITQQADAWLERWNTEVVPIVGTAR